MIFVRSIEDALSPDVLIGIGKLVIFDTGGLLIEYMGKISLSSLYTSLDLASSGGMAPDIINEVLPL